jgi:hypothetical protein
VQPTNWTNTLVGCPQQCIAQRFPNCGAAHGGVVGPLGGARVVCVRDIYFERMWGKIYFGTQFAWLKDLVIT